jgi:hypothetical protein
LIRLLVPWAVIRPERGGDDVVIRADDPKPVAKNDQKEAQAKLDDEDEDRMGSFVREPRRADAAATVPMPISSRRYIITATTTTTIIIITGA